MTAEELQILSKSEIFYGLNESDIKHLLSDLTFTIKNYKRDNYVSIQGDIYKELLVVMSGTVSSEISDAAGKKVKLETFYESSVIAPGILFAADNRFPVTITANTDCSLIVISKDLVLDILQQNRICLNNYLSLLGNKVNILADKIRLFKFSSIQQKIAGYLLDLDTKQKSKTIIIPYTREQLADFFGVARPSLSREFSRMSDAGILAIEGKKVHLLKKTALKYLLDGEILD